MNDTKKDNGYAKTARDLRKTRARRLLIRFVSTVVLPAIAVLVYYVFFASDVYQSEALITVQSSENRPMGGLEFILGGVTGSGTARDSLAVQEFITSRNMLKHIEKKHGFTAHYSDNDVDWWSRLPADATFEEKFKYYKKRVKVNYDSQSGILTLSVQAYSAAQSKAISDTILSRSEEMVNHLSKRAKQDQIAFAKKEVREAEDRFKKSQHSLLALQNEDSQFHPDKMAGAVMSVQAALEVEAAKLRAKLSATMAVMSPTAPKVVALRQQIRALDKQVKRENKRLVDPENGALNTSIVQFESAMMEKKFAEKEYQTAMASLKIAKMEADRKSRYLATIASPSLPDEALYPKRFLGVLTVFLVCLAIFGIGSLLIAAVKEHVRL